MSLGSRGLGRWHSAPRDGHFSTGDAVGSLIQLALVIPGHGLFDGQDSGCPENFPEINPFESAVLNLILGIKQPFSRLAN